LRTFAYQEALDPRHEVISTQIALRMGKTPALLCRSRKQGL